MFDTAFNMGYLGLQSQSERLAAISDNIANVKTTGYKRTDVRFVELMNDSRNPQPNLRLTHVRPSPHQFLGIQGELSLSEVETNVAVDGKGLFIINTKADGTGQTYFTRDGTFAPDYQGYYVNKGGGYLQGFPTTATTLSDSSTQTNIARTATAVSGLTTVRTPRDSIIQAASATTTASASGNVPLIATQTVGTTYAHDLAVYDNLNGVHDIRLTWTATATGYTLAASSADGTVTINGGASTPVTVGTTTSAVIGVTWTNPATASASSITLNLSSLQTGQSTQFTATAAATNGNIDGYVKSLSWDEYGQVN
ncbi:MAG: flagellar hook-basal body complex protein, partial [Alphaproteobacteria bacterium]|nr:flagellar hook-basal body complex protein [Alphaproteobacteria bacterium]